MTKLADEIRRRSRSWVPIVIINGVILFWVAMMALVLSKVPK